MREKVRVRKILSLKGGTFRKIDGLCIRGIRRQGNHIVYKEFHCR